MKSIIRKNKFLLPLFLVMFFAVLLSSCAKHTHKWEEGFVTNSTHHWHECADEKCDEISENEAHKGGTATCTSKATCEVCGVEYGELGNHQYSSTYVSDGNSHWKVCSLCNATTTKEAHKGGTATCTSKAICDVCKKEYGNLLEHKYSETYSSDKNSHWNECSVCHEKVNNEAHKGGTATCTSLAHCEVCNEVYGSFKEHQYNMDEWGYKEADGHAHKCNDCVHRDTVIAHTPNIDAATESEAKYCTECGYIIEPKLNHTHKWSTTLTNGLDTHYYVCSGCSERKDEKDHAYTSSSKDETHHWNVCECGATSNKVAHTMEIQAIEAYDTPLQTGEVGVIRVGCSCSNYTEVQVKVSDFIGIEDAKIVLNNGVPNISLALTETFKTKLLTDYPNLDATSVANAAFSASFEYFEQFMGQEINVVAEVDGKVIFVNDIVSSGSTDKHVFKLELVEGSILKVYSATNVLFVGETENNATTYEVTKAGIYTIYVNSEYEVWPNWESAVPYDNYYLKVNDAEGIVVDKTDNSSFAKYHVTLAVGDVLKVMGDNTVLKEYTATIAGVHLVVVDKGNQVTISDPSVIYEDLTIYYYNNLSWEDVYLHAWTNDGDITSWPGNLMSEVEAKDNWYEITIEAVSFEGLQIIFNNGSTQTGNILVDQEGGALYFYGTNETGFTSFEDVETEAGPVVEMAYYLVGSMNNWEQGATYKLTVNPSNKNELMILDVTLDANTELKISDVTGIYYGYEVLKINQNYLSTFILDAEGDSTNIVITVAGTYSFYFDTVGDGEGKKLWIEHHCENISNDNDCTTADKCVCGRVVVEANENHTYNQNDWTEDATGHWHTCTIEGCNNTSTVEEHVPNIAAATEDEAKYCTVCNYVIEAQLTHVHNWANDLTIGDTSHYYECSGCNERKDEVTHDYSVEVVDPTHHWNKCSGCESMDAKIEHDFTNIEGNDDYHWGECSCGYIDVYVAHKYVITSMVEYDKSVQQETGNIGEIIATCSCEKELKIVAKVTDFEGNEKMYYALINNVPSLCLPLTNEAKEKLLEDYTALDETSVLNAAFSAPFEYFEIDIIAEIDGVLEWVNDKGATDTDKHVFEVTLTQGSVLKVYHKVNGVLQDGENTNDYEYEVTESGIYTVYVNNDYHVYLSRISAIPYESYTLEVDGKELNKSDKTDSSCFAKYDVELEVGDVLKVMGDTTLLKEYTVVNSGIHRVTVDKENNVTVVDPTVLFEDITLYYYNNLGWGTVYAYAWTAENDVVKLTGDWPGIIMTPVDSKNNWYQVTVEAESLTGLQIIFHNNIGGQTADIVVDQDGGELYFYGLEIDGLTSFEAVEDATVIKYYLHGVYGSWVDAELFKFVVNPENENEVMLLNVEIEANTELKIHSSANNYYGYEVLKINPDYSSTFIVEAEGETNIVITEDGIYSFYFDIVNEGSKIWIEHHCTHNQEVVEDKYLASSADCENAATYYKSCTCGRTVDTAATFTNGDALGHTEVVDEAVSATCTETGLTAGKHCSVCNEVLVAQEEVDALGHTEEVDEAVSATCTETGLTAGKHCSVCNEVLVEQEEVDALGHTYEEQGTEVKVAATCTETGLNYKVCDCGARSEETYVTTALGHNYEESNWGYKEADGHAHSCTRCDAHDTVVAHTPNIEAATEDEAKYCTVCNYVIEAQLTHTHSFTVAQSDDTHHWNKCSGCEETDTKVEHTYEAQGTEVKSQATCTAKEISYKVCDCGAKGTETWESSNALGHDESSTTWLTNQENTEHYVVCAREGCEEHVKVGTHTGGSATCTAKAVCTTCNKEYGELNSTTHSSQATEAISNNNGTHNIVYSCCDAVKEESVACSGGTATHTLKAVCSVCEHEYGNVLAYDSYVIEIDGQENTEISVTPDENQYAKWSATLEIGKVVKVYGVSNNNIEIDTYTILDSGTHTFSINNNNELVVIVPVLEKVTLYYYNSDNWDKVNVYAWIDRAIQINSWPGEQISVEEEGSSWYKVELSVYTTENLMIIFNYIKSDDEIYQTGNIDYDANNNYFYGLNVQGYPSKSAVDEARTTLYFTPNSQWKSNEGYRFAAYFYGNGETWVDMTDADNDGTYECEIPSGYTSVIFCSMKSGTTENNWDNKQYQTVDLTLSSANNLYTLGENKIYLKPSASWKEANARFAAYFFGNGETWVDMTDADNDGIYECEIPSGYTSVIFCRMNPDTTENNWNNSWGQTADLTLSSENNMYIIDSSTWSIGGKWSVNV